MSGWVVGCVCVYVGGCGFRCRCVCGWVGVDEGMGGWESFFFCGGDVCMAVDGLYRAVGNSFGY